MVKTLSLKRLFEEEIPDDESDIDIMIMVDMSREELSKYRMTFSKFFMDDEI